jgi:hypothetical protein
VEAIMKRLHIAWPALALVITACEKQNDVTGGVEPMKTPTTESITEPSTTQPSTTQPSTTQPSTTEAKAPPAPAVREAHARAFVALLEKGRYEDARKDFDATMTQAAPASMLSDIWKGLATQFGAYQGIDNVSETTSGTHALVVVTCKFEKEPAGLRVVYDGAGKIAGIQIVPPVKK